MMLLLLAYFLLGITEGQFVGVGNNDPCPKGFIHHQKSCYKYFGTNVKFIEAWTICKMVNSEMLAIDSKEENNFITQLTRTLLSSPIEYICMHRPSERTQITFGSVKCQSMTQFSFPSEQRLCVPAYYWTGGNDLMTPGQYTWGSRSYREVTYTAWDTGEPRPITKTSHSGCIQISVTGSGGSRLALKVLLM